MGWRISLYRVSKEVANHWKNITEDDYSADKKGKLFDELKKE
jgi:hypothetical protein